MWQVTEERCSQLWILHHFCFNPQVHHPVLCRTGWCTCESQRLWWMRNRRHSTNSEWFSSGCSCSPDQRRTVRGRPSSRKCQWTRGLCAVMPNRLAKSAIVNNPQSPGLNTDSCKGGWEREADEEVKCQGAQQNTPKYLHNTCPKSLPPCSFFQLPQVYQAKTCLLIISMLFFVIVSMLAFSSEHIVALIAWLILGKDHGFC